MNSLQISLNEVKNLISETMKIDENNNSSIETRLDVYQKYVKSIKDIFMILDEDLKTYSSENKLDTLKNIRINHSSILTTAQNCFHRMSAQLLNEKESKPRSQTISYLDEDKRNRTSNVFRSLTPVSSIDILLAERPVNPIDSARFNVQKLVKATNALLKSERLSVSEKTSIQLRISRKIEENLSIARKHENQLCRMNTNNLEILLKKIDEDIIHYHFLKSHPDFSQLYRQSQLFYHHILKDSRTYSLVKSNHSPEVSCLTFILKMSNVHPVVAFINKIIDQLLNFSISKENQNPFLDALKTFNDTIEDLSKMCCLIINTNLSDQIRNIYPKLQNILIGFIFKNSNLSSLIYKFLFIAYDDELRQYNENVKFIEENYNFEILLPDKFKTQLEVISILDKQISEFSRLRQVYNPLDRLDILCQIVTDLMSKIQNQNASLEIGADELVPILVYMIIRFNSAELFLHGKYLEHLMPSSYLIGIEGYMLVSIICAITFCVSVNFSIHISKG